MGIWLYFLLVACKSISFYWIIFCTLSIHTWYQGVVASFITTWRLYRETIMENRFIFNYTIHVIRLKGKNEHFYFNDQTFSINSNFLQSLLISHNVIFSAYTDDPWILTSAHNLPRRIFWLPKRNAILQFNGFGTKFLWDCCICTNSKNFNSTSNSTTSCMVIII